MAVSAQFILTGEDRTAAAFRSVDNNVRTLSRTVGHVRSMFAGLGLAVSGRALVGWITSAVKAAEVTGEHAEQIRAAQEATARMKKASDELAVSIGVGLVPAMEALSAVFVGWNRIATGNDPFPFEAQIERLRDQLHAMEVQFRASGGMSSEWKRQFTADMDEVKEQIDDLLRKQQQVLGVGIGGLTPPDKTIAQWREAFRRLRIPEMKDAGKIEWDWLPEDDLEEMVVTAHEILLKPFPVAEVRALFEPVKDQGLKAAATLGEGFRGAFADWMVGTERDFGELLKRMVAQMAVSGIFEAFGSMFAGSSTGIGKFFGAFFGGSRASGGSVTGGMVYKVHPGEAFFAPGRDGSVGRASGGVTVSITQHNDLRGNSPDQTAAALAASNARLKQDVMASIADLMRRGRFAT